MNDLICIGGINLDRKAQCGQNVVFGTSNPVAISETCGGVARNVAENLGRLGCRPILLGCVGDDHQAAWVLEQTRAHGVDVQHVKRLDHARTGSYTAILDNAGELVLGLAEMSINDHFTPELLTQMWHVIRPDALVFMDANLPAASLAYVIERCRTEGQRLIIDPISPIKAQRLPTDLSGVSVILPNRHEAATLANLSEFSVDQASIAAQQIHARGVATVAITLGEHGVLLSTPHDQQHLPAMACSVVDVTGAGDALTAGFMYGMAHNASLERCCTLGLAAAALAVQTQQSVAPDLSSAIIEEAAASMRHTL